MSPEERAAALAMLGGGGAANAGMQLAQRGAAPAPAPMQPQAPMQTPYGGPMRPPMSQADFSGYPATVQPGGRSLSPASAKKLAQMLRGAAREP